MLGLLDRGAVARVLAVVCLALLSFGPAQACFAGVIPGGLKAALVAGDIRVDATPTSLGVVWWIDGDSDLDSAMTLAYRAQGASQWQPAAPAMRTYPTLRVGDGPLNLNCWAASTLFLSPGRTYELQLALTDPDGGAVTRVVTGTTASVLEFDLTGRQRYVVPGRGGGSGSQEDPLRGLQAAADSAQPGDTFHLAAGSYTPFQLVRSGTAGHPIAFVGPDQGSAIIDGGDTDRGVVTLGEYDQPTGFVVLQGVTIRNGAWGIDAQHTRDILIARCTIQDVDWGITNRREEGLEARQMVADCIISGRTPWPGSGIPAERGIDLRGWGNVACHNRVDHFGDGISLQPFTGPSYGNDVYGNDVYCCVDDGIEVDYNQANLRVWRNRVTNCRMGVSVQPIYGGPAYILRNELFNIESEPIKMHNHTAGLFIAHNSGVKLGNGYGDGGAMWRNAILRNNLFLGTHYAFEFTTVADEGFRDCDYNAWGTSRVGASWFKWDNQRFDRLVQLQAGTGQELHGLEAAFGHVIDAALPSSWDTLVAPTGYDLRLVPDAPERDAGLALPNLNDPYVSDSAPDMGALEAGHGVPLYGPRDNGAGAASIVWLPYLGD